MMRVIEDLLAFAGWLDPDPGGRRFDAAFGTETCRFDLGNYEPTPPRIVEAALDALEEGGLPLAERTFVDLGSGKGRVVLIASRRALRAAVGIEHRAALHAAAERNRAAFEGGGHARCPVHLLCGDAAVVPLPSGPLVVWLFNPFGAEVLGVLLRRLRDRAVHLVYVVPLELPLVVAAGFEEVAQGSDPDWPWRILFRDGGARGG